MPVSKKSKKSVTKKTVTKKTVAKKPVVKKTTGKKTVSKKAAPAKKPVTKKATGKSVAKKPVKKAAPKVAAPKVAAPAKSEKKVRSFKVQLPGSDGYKGRFTGLTPYQAANKALSKYYRENKGKTAKILFTIKESTRASKRNVYPYEGKRIKLDKPIEYQIDGGKTIVKKYKNKLRKIKKAEQQVASA